jgi:hypothetical protein
MAPTIHREGPFRFFFYSKEGNEPAHVHVERDTCSAKVWLQPVQVASNDGFPAHELGRIAAIVEAHQPQFLEAWHEHFATE